MRANSGLGEQDVGWGDDDVAGQSSCGGAGVERGGFGKSTHWDAAEQWSPRGWNLVVVIVVERERSVLIVDWGMLWGALMVWERVLN